MSIRHTHIISWLSFLLISTNIPIYSTSCSSKKKYDCRVDKSFDGSDWYGLYGKFDDSDYEITEERITYKHLNGINYVNNLVVPNYVWCEEKKLPVYLDENLFFGYLKISGSVYLNEFMTDIPDHIFENCVNIEKIFLMNKIINVGERSFYNCLSLKSIEFSECSEYYHYLYADEIFKFIESISDEAFYRVELNINIVFDKLENLGNSAFSDCTHIKSVTFSNNCLSQQKCLKNSSFSNCWNLQFVSLNKNIISIGDECFLGCYNLKKVNWEIDSNHENVLIGKKAFSHCYALAQICSNLSNFSPSYIGDYAFDSDKAFNFNYFDSENNTFFLNTSFIGEYAFSSCETIKLVKFYPSENFIICSNAFYYCYRLDCIDFSNFGLSVPKWYGVVHIFGNVCKNGVFYISNLDYSDSWLDFFNSQTNEGTAECWDFKCKES